MNGVVITDCNECWEHRPADSLGFGCYCDEAQKEVPTVKETAPIPDWCPKRIRGKIYDG